MSAHSHGIVHLVGSIPLDDAENVFRTVAGAVPDHLARLPDGETGERIGWIRFMQEMLANHPDMEEDPDTPPLKWTQWDGVLLREIPQYRFKPGSDVSAATFNTPYSDEAIASFELFGKLQDDGVIPSGTKFQISIPTPLAPGYNYVAPGAQDDFIEVYTRHVVETVERISAALPNDRIAFQWDVCQEVLMWEGYYDVQPADYKEEIFRVLGEVGDAVPEPAELGYHLCYGSPRDEHIVQPRDSANMVEMTNGIVAAVNRSVQFIHLPVPKDRSDDAYFAALADLKLPAGCDLYLGLIHHEDEAGDAARLAAARKVVKVDGVSSECGWGRGDPERVPSLLASHRKAAATLGRNS